MLLVIVQSLTAVMLVLSYLATISYLQTPETYKYFEFFGINSINDFSISTTARGHIICEAILSLLTAYLNRLFIYQTFNILLTKDQGS